MFNLLQVITLATALDPARREAFVATIEGAIAGLPAVRGALFAPTLPGTYNGGDFLLRLTFEDKAAYETALVGEAWAPAAALLADATVAGHVEYIPYQGGSSGGSSDGAGLYRVALYCANVDPTPERLAAFRDEKVRRPHLVSAILRWQLSETDEGAGTRPWTHVWEQEYRDLDGLNGPYMMHPEHWAYGERWFDPEYPECLIDPVLVHTFCAMDRPVII